MHKNTKSVVIMTVIALLLSGIVAPAVAELTEKASGTPYIPVREITVFKDGHAFVDHFGNMLTDDSGNVVLDYLPAPLMGTFWSYSIDKQAKLKSVVSSRAKISKEKTAVNIRELLEANIGADVLITEESQYAASILAVPNADDNGNSAENNNRVQSPGVVLLRASGGVKVVKIERIKDVTFLSDPKLTRTEEKTCDRMTLHLDWAGSKPNKSAAVGYAYVQKGIRWIPSYKVTIDGEGNAKVKLQATIINELVDLENVTANLVIGVPGFAFSDLVDPVSFEKRAVQLQQQVFRNDFDSNRISNAIMSQSFIPNQARPVPVRESRSVDLGPDVPGAGKSEDLFIFTLKNITLKKGERMVLPIQEFALKYEDVYSLDVPLLPPPEFRRNFNSQQQEELARQQAAPKAMHVIRLRNNSEYPLTTAPAMVFHGDRLLAQGLMTYASPGSYSDLKATTAIDIHVSRSEEEVERKYNSVKWSGDHFTKIDLAGKINITNFFDHPVKLEVSRQVLGNIDTVDNDGQKSKTGFGEWDWAGSYAGYPCWWHWYSWPWWWHHFNGFGSAKWNIALEAGQPVELNYTYHYYWN